MLRQTHEITSALSKNRESSPFPLPPVSEYGPNKFSPAPPITSSYFLSGTALRKQSELRVRGVLDSQQLTRQEAEGKSETCTSTHAHTHNICTACQVKHLQSDTSCEPKENNDPHSNVLHAKMIICSFGAKMCLNVEVEKNLIKRK